MYNNFICFFVRDSRYPRPPCCTRLSRSKYRPRQTERTSSDPQTITITLRTQRVVQNRPFLLPSIPLQSQASTCNGTAVILLPFLSDKALMSASLGFYPTCAMAWKLILFLEAKASKTHFPWIFSDPRNFIDRPTDSQRPTPETDLWDPESP